jgi:hypothetical protein
LSARGHGGDAARKKAEPSVCRLLLLRVGLGAYVGYG